MRWTRVNAGALPDERGDGMGGDSDGGGGRLVAMGTEMAVVVTAVDRLAVWTAMLTTVIALDGV